MFRIPDFEQILEHTHFKMWDGFQYNVCHPIFPFLLKLCLPNDLSFATLPWEAVKNLPVYLCKKYWCLGPTSQRFWLIGLRYLRLFKSSPGDFNVQPRFRTTVSQNAPPLILYWVIPFLASVTIYKIRFFCIITVFLWWSSEADKLLLSEFLILHECSMGLVVSFCLLLLTWLFLLFFFKIFHF